MSKATWFATVSIFCGVAAFGMFLSGSAGPWMPLAGVALGAAGISLIVSLRLRRNRDDRPARERDFEQAERARDTGSGAVFLAIGLLLGVVALLVTLLVAQGEARGHGVFHFLFGAASLGLYAAVRSRWQPSADSTSSAWRTVLLVTLWISSAAAFLESIGAAGYDEFNSGHRIAWLTTLHGLAGPVAGMVILTIPLSVGVLAIVLVRGRMRAHRAHTPGTPAPR